MLPLTGERTVPDLAEENYWFRRHAAAYEFALPYVADRRVLEVGCGEGYGTAHLAGTAARVVGLDYDASTVRHAARRYGTTDGPAAFVRGNLAALPVRSASMDVLATLQVIEHVWDHAQFVRECVRVLRPDGLLLVTTPNRLTFSPGRSEPLNPFHTKEFTAAELIALLAACGLRVDVVAGLHAGRRLAMLDRRHGGSFVDAQLATPPEQWHPRLRRDVAGVTTADFAVRSATHTDVDDSLDLVVLATPARSSGASVGDAAGCDG